LSAGVDQLADLVATDLTRHRQQCTCGRSRVSDLLAAHRPEEHCADRNHLGEPDPDVNHLGPAGHAVHGALARTKPYVARFEPAEAGEGKPPRKR
jgi:hypothetical protein